MNFVNAVIGFINSGILTFANYPVLFQNTVTLKNGTDQWRMTVSGTELRFTYSNDNFVTSKTGYVIGIE